MLDFKFIEYISQKLAVEKDKLHQFIDPLKHIFSFLYFSENVFSYSSKNAMDLFYKENQEKENGNFMGAKDILMGYLMRLQNAWILIRPTLKPYRCEYGDVLIEIISVPTDHVCLSNDACENRYYQYSFDKIISSAKIYIDVRNADYKTSFNEWEYDLEGACAKSINYTYTWGDDDYPQGDEKERVELYRKMRFKPVKLGRLGFNDVLLANFISSLKNDFPYLNPNNGKDNIESLFSEDAVNKSVLVRAGFSFYGNDMVIAIPNENDVFYYVHQPS